MPEFTPTESRMMQILRDGRPHSKDELAGCLFDDLSAKQGVHRFITQIRAKLKPVGEGINCERGSFRLVRFISTDDT